jgi:hypothetical protein
MARFVGSPMRRTMFVGEVGIPRRRLRRAGVKVGETPQEKPALAREWPELQELLRQTQNEGRGRE